SDVCSSDLFTCRDAGSSKAQQSTQSGVRTVGLHFLLEVWQAARRQRRVKMRSNPMLTRFAGATVAVLLGCGSAYAQARMNVSPLPALGMTSPLGVPNAPVGHTGVPMGATELATPGVSPTTFGASPLIGATCAGASPAPASDAMPSATTGASAGIGTSTAAGSPTTGADAATGSSIAGLSGSSP